MLGVAIFVLAQAAAGGGSGSRPPECAPLESGSASNVWERAKSPSLRHYCDLLASGAARLAAGSGADEAREAIAIAEEAARALPGRAAPGVLRGRALARLGRWGDAAQALGDAMAQDGHALDDPAALLAWGRALGREARVAEAEAAFHALLPRGSDLPPAERGRAEIEAALLAEARGAAGLDEAIALLRQARRDAQDVLQALAGIALSLALDRAGEREESHVVLAGDAKQDPRAVLAEAVVRETLADAAALPEADALAAFALAVRDPGASRDDWRKYLAGPASKGPWAEHARSHATSGGGARGVRGMPDMREKGAP